MEWHYPSMKKKIKLKTVGMDVETWLKNHDLRYCPRWNIKLRGDKVCKERKQLAEETKNRFSLGDGSNFNSMSRCLTCETGTVPLSQMVGARQEYEKERDRMAKESEEKYFPVEDLGPMFPTNPDLIDDLRNAYKTKQQKNKVEVGDICTCVKCSHVFEAYKRGSQIIRKVCKNCVDHSAMAAKRLKAQKSDKLIDTLLDLSNTVTDLNKLDFAPDDLSEIDQAVETFLKTDRAHPEIKIDYSEKYNQKETHEKIVEEVMKAVKKKPHVVHPEPVQKETFAGYAIPPPAEEANPMKWVSQLFDNDPNPQLLEKLIQEAKEQRRDLKNQVLYILERWFKDWS